MFGASGPSNFDCSGFVCWSFTKSGVKRMPRTTAWRIYKDYCNPVSPSEAQPGDIIFFHSTYNSGTPISHVGIYAGIQNIGNHTFMVLEDQDRREILCEQKTYKY